MLWKLQGVQRIYIRFCFMCSTADEWTYLIFFTSKCKFNPSWMILDLYFKKKWQFSYIFFCLKLKDILNFLNKEKAIFFQEILFKFWAVISKNDIKYDHIHQILYLLNIFEERNCTTNAFWKYFKHFLSEWENYYKNWTLWYISKKKHFTIFFIKIQNTL